MICWVKVGCFWFFLTSQVYLIDSLCLILKCQKHFNDNFRGRHCDHQKQIFCTASRGQTVTFRLWGGSDRNFLPGHKIFCLWWQNRHSFPPSKKFSVVFSYQTTSFLQSSCYFFFTQTFKLVKLNGCSIKTKFILKTRLSQLGALVVDPYYGSLK